MGQDKKNFEWSRGDKLQNEDYEAIGNVRQTGFNKLANGLHADPSKRKEERKIKLSQAKAKAKKEGYYFEESQSGLSQKVSKEKASHIIEKTNEGSKGMNRFKDFSKKTKD